MKKYMALALALLTTAICHGQGSIDLKNISVSKVLGIYSDFTGKQLVIESGVTNQTKTITIKSTPGTKEETIKVIESALREQAGVICEPLDGKRVAVKLAPKPNSR